MKEHIKKTIIFVIAALILYGILFFVIKNGIINNYKIQIIMLVGINIILALSLNLIIGFTGQLALGHACFMAIGAYTSAVLTVNFHMPFIVSIIGGGLVAGLAGFLIGLPTLRLRGDYLAITTLGFGEIVRVIITNIDYLGGARGFVNIPPKSTFTWVYFAVVVTFLVIYNIIHSSNGRAMISVREDEIAAEAMGINTTKYKIEAFVIGSFFAGIAGVLFAHLYMFIDPSGFTFMKSIEIVIFVVLGGMGSITGSILSAGVLTVLSEFLRDFADYRMVFYSVLLIVMMLFRPQGLMGTKEFSLGFLKKKNKVGGKKNGTIKSK